MCTASLGWRFCPCSGPAGMSLARGPPLAASWGKVTSQCAPGASCRFPQLQPVSLGSDFSPKRQSPFSGTFRKTIILHSVPAAVTLALAAILWVLLPLPSSIQHTCPCCLELLNKRKGLNFCCPRGAGLLVARPAQGKESS